ncbi:chorismate mutase AroH [Clostridium tetani]|uniref:chorismate mutase n=1 Tax=Clostridium tetani TaxID=1513 RepID=A0A4V1LEI6_CLOTA|nr:chorismate mutase [Clostridium tetani]RXI47538.1 chorismate mutase [Clostridium tetani]BDR67036.1 chorismate mutase AroH [Clostridium tetani]BDR80923.1 chorismate mutase AroH [Clostridium tetani]BDR89380.1 chorismate mutase AroH [Clostridium tetani]
MYAIRGAISIDENSVEEIRRKTLELFESILKENKINKEDIVSILFSCTKDIDKAYPGKFLREKYHLNKVGIMHFNEMIVENSLNLCIRILILLNGHKLNIKYVYLGKAKKLRDDLIEK